MYKLYKHIWERKENILKKSLVIDKLTKPYSSVQIVQVEIDWNGWSFQRNIINVQVVQAHLGEIRKYSEIFYNYFLGETLLQCTNCTSRK